MHTYHFSRLSTLALSLLISACTIEGVELPCLFGAWQVRSVQPLDSSSTARNLQLGDIAIVSGDTLDFSKKDDVLSVRGSKAERRVPFKQVPGKFNINVNGKNHVVQVLEAGTGADSAVLQYNNIRIVLAR